MCPVALVLERTDHTQGKAQGPGEMEVDGDVLGSPSPKCARLFKPLSGKKVDLTATGTRDHGALLKLLTCESKARKLCGAELAAYTPCHSSVMSVLSPDWL